MVTGILISSFSQTSYPRKVLIENDTVLAITKQQLISINRTINDYLHLKKINVTLQRDLLASDSLCFIWKQVALKSDTIIFKQEDKYNQIVEMSQSLKAQNKRNKKISIGVGISGTLIGLVLGVLLMK